MASTLKVTISEELNLEGTSYSATKTKTFTTITSVYKTIVNVSTSGGEVLAIAAAAGNIGTLNLTSEHPTFFCTDAAHATGTHVDIDSITADANTAACNLEIMVAMNG